MTIADMRMPRICARQVSFAMCLATLAGCSSFVVSDRLPGHDGAYYALPRAQLPVTIVRSGCELEATFADISYVPDLAAQYRLRLDHNWFSQDKLTVVTDADGLLMSVNGKSVDQTSQILKDAARLAATVSFRSASGGPLGAGEKGGDFDCSKSDEGDFSSVVLVDPTSTREQLMVISSNLGNGVTVGARALGESETPSTPVDCAEVVCFRAMRPYVISVEQAETPPNEGNYKKKAFRFMVLAPDPNLVMGVRLDRQLLSTSDVKLTFDHGVLTKYDTVKNSEASSLLQLPLDVAAEVLKVPGELSTIRVKELENEAQLLRNQKSLLESQAALIAAQRAVLDASKKPPEDTPTAPAQ